jgi:hypothetical protein
MTDRIGGPKPQVASRATTTDAGAAKGASEAPAASKAAAERAGAGAAKESFEKVQLGRMQKLLTDSALRIDGVTDSTSSVAAYQGGAKGAEVKGYEAWPCIEASKDQQAAKGAESFAKGAAKGVATEASKVSAKGAGEVAAKGAEGYGKDAKMAETGAKGAEGAAKGQSGAGFGEAKAMGKHHEASAKGAAAAGAGWDGAAAAKGGEGAAKGAGVPGGGQEAKGVEALSKGTEASWKGGAPAPGEPYGAGELGASAGRGRHTVESKDDGAPKSMVTGPARQGFDVAANKKL